MIAPTRHRPVEIIGGGLAGLGLALGLRRVDVPVIVHEAGTYPRHRVCGEFITSLDDHTIETLGLGPLLQDARSAETVAWYRADRTTHRHRLPEPARCLSRFALDHRMAQALVTNDGELIENSRPTATPAEGRITATGRRPDLSAPWLGVKMHFTGLTLSDDLELHLGQQAYVGLTRIEGDRINVCGLFHRGNVRSKPPAAANPLDQQLRAAGLTTLAERLMSASADPASLCTVAGLNYRHERAAPESAPLGDHFALIPPFTGHGMTIALQSAALAVGPLQAWSRGERDWASTRREIAARHRRQLLPKLRRAQHLHGWLLTPKRQHLLAVLARRDLLPLRWVYGLLH
ncbi:hypothetical protein [Synoicihabitans lomoniglobus]|uniref:FAD-binding domain-containing protein n=1 Tax=Synoicihabitans lomoniglobus TaxID=2909285 RepID=A0AAF0CMQ3_9BACT|nr:hypothetical protein [Opitutaceae bacterium LMO-M01]WED64473.1 hypothetical protein PXH66_19205 [Opitutaceae bacterium LMO-M01]